MTRQIAPQGPGMKVLLIQDPTFINQADPQYGTEATSYWHDDYQQYNSYNSIASVDNISYQNECEETSYFQDDSLENQL